MVPYWVIGLYIKGMPYPSSPDPQGDGDPILFTNARLPNGSPAGLPASAYDWIEDSPNAASGFTFNSGIRNPFPTGNSVKVKILDNKYTPNEFSLSRMFAGEPVDSYSGWQLMTTSLDESTTDIQVSGASSPMDQSVYWIHNEAVFVDGITQDSDNTWTLNVTRGACGSRAVKHDITPKLFPPGDNGSSEAMRLDKYIDLDSYRFLADIVYMRVDASGTATLKWSFKGYVDGSPMPTEDSYIFNISSLTKLMAEHQIEPTANPTPLNYHINVTSFLPDEAGNQYGLCNHGEIYLDRYSCEYFFNEVLHIYGSEEIDPAMLTGLSSRFESGEAKNITYKVLVESNSHKFLYSIRKPELVTVTLPNGNERTIVRCKIKLLFDEVGKPIISSGASISDKIVLVPTVDGTGGMILNAGWYISPGGIRIPDTIERPKISLRVWVNDTPMNFLCYMMFSNCGGGVNSADYDYLIGHRGLNLDPNDFNIGTVTASPLEDTIEIKQLNQIISRKYDFRLKADDKFEALSTNIMRFHCLLMGIEPNTGKLFFRRWFRHFNNTVYSPDLINHNSKKTLRQAQKLDRVAALRLYSGFEELDYKPAFARTVRVAGSNANDIKNATQEIRIWLKGNQIDNGSLASGDVHDVIYSFFTMLRDSPLAYPFDVSVEDVFYKAGDTLQIDDDMIPNKQTGRGVDNRQVIVFSVDVNAPKGVQTIRAIRDPLNVLSMSTVPMIAPAYRCSALYDITRSGSDIDITFALDKIGYQSFDIDNEQVIAELDTYNGYVRVICPALHNPTTGSKERAGYFEYYGKVLSYADKGTLTQLLTIRVKDVWERDSKTLDGNFVADQTFIVLTDCRIAAGSVENLLITPIANEGYNNDSGLNYIHISPANDIPPYDGIYYTMT
jgi:hypothetical protein